MTQTPRRFFRHLIFALSAATAAGMASATAEFRIMSDEEVAMHNAVMAQLDGEARAEYRDAQYEILRQRAAEQGFTMPEDPPWIRAATAAPGARPDEGAKDVSVEAKDPTKAETSERHAAMREKMRAHREALQQAPDAPVAVDAETGSVTASEASRPQTPVRPTQPPVAAAATTAPAPSPSAASEAETPAMPAAVEPAAPTSPAVVTAATAPQTATSSLTATASPKSAGTVSQADASGATPTASAVGPGEPPARPAPPAAPEPPTAPPAVGGSAAPNAAAMNAYREEMRTRFESYMKERQAQMEELARRQREQREAAMANSRQTRPAQPAPSQRPMPYPYPNMPAYGPRYPSAYPGYQTPYWQQR